MTSQKRQSLRTPQEGAVDGGQSAPSSGIAVGDRVSLFISECPDPVSATVTAVYLDATGQEIADLEFGWKLSDGYSTGTQATRFLTRRVGA